jgi:predicted pyridoxine 5'-phosphate oxidase superfamily flavin-nucleotide-binding protein
VDSPTRIALALPARLHPKAGSGVSFVFLLPGLGETLRINGTVDERSGDTTAIAIAEVFVHCAQCILRSGLWRGGPARRAASPPDGVGPLRAPPVAGFLAAAPFALVSSWDAAGSSDTSPRGDEPGFLCALDGQTLAIADRRGNRRTDTFHNLLSCPQIAIAAMIPGRDELLHLRGTAYVTDDAALLATMAVGGKAPPPLALIVRVEHAEVVTNDAVRSAGLWRPAVRSAEVPDLMGVAAQHLIRSTAPGAKAALLRLVGRFLGAFPRLTRRLIDVAYRRGLAAEGYSGTRPTRRSPRA